MLKKITGAKKADSPSKMKSSDNKNKNNKILKHKGEDANRQGSMGSRLTVQSNMGSDSIRVLPTGVGAAAASKTNSSNDQRSQGVSITPSGGATKKKHGRTLQAQSLLRENSLQKQLSSNLIFQRQQQRLSAALVDDHNEVPDSYTAIRVPYESTASAGSPVQTATLPRRSPSSQQIATNLTDLDPQILTRSGTRSRRNSSASTPPSMGQQQHKRSSSCRLGRSCSRHSLCRSQIFNDGDEDDIFVTSLIPDPRSKPKKDAANMKLWKKDSIATTTSASSYPVRNYENAEGNYKERENFKSINPASNMSIVIFGDSTVGSPTQWKSSVVLTGPPQEAMSDVQDEFGFQRGVRTPDFVYMRIHPSCGRKYIVPVESSGKTRLLEMKHILRQESVAGDFGIFQNNLSMYYAFVRVRPPLDETFVVTSGDNCKEVAVFTGKTWEVVRTYRREEK